MNPKNSTKFHSVDVSTAIQFKNQTALGGKKSTTGFILDNLNNMHQIMTSKEGWRVDSVDHMRKYEKDVKYLKWFADEFLKKVSLGSGRIVSIYGIRMSINTLINLSRELLIDEGMKSFKPSRLLTDGIENVFSILRSLTPQPSAVQVSQSLRIMSISQLQFDPIDGVYNWDESDEVSINFVELIKNQNPVRSANSDEFDGGLHLSRNYSWRELFGSKIDFNSFVCFLSCLIGKVIKKVNCIDCKHWMQESDINNLKDVEGYELLTMRHSLDNSYDHVPSISFLQFSLNVEFLMRCFSELVFIESPNFKKKCVDSTLFLNEIQSFHCSDIITKITEPFIASRIRMLLHKREKHKAVKFASKSIK